MGGSPAAGLTGDGHRDVPLPPPVPSQLLPGQKKPENKALAKGRRTEAAQVGGRERSPTFLTSDNRGKKRHGSIILMG